MNYVTYKGKEFKVEKNKLSLKKEGITSISEIKGLDNLGNLEELSFAFNQISEIKGLENLTNLQTLDLRFNRISELEGLNSLVNLKSLALAGNRISKIKGLDNLENLEKLDLSLNQIYEIEGLEKLTQLQKLYLWGNKFTEIKGFENLISLKFLKLDIIWKPDELYRTQLSETWQSLLKHGEFYLNGELIPNEEIKKMGRFKRLTNDVGWSYYVNAKKIVKYCKVKNMSGTHLLISK